MFRRFAHPFADFDVRRVRSAVGALLVLGHVARSIVLSAVLTLIGLFLVDWCGRRLVARYSDRLGFDRLSDVGSVPLLLMLLEVAMVLLSPAALAYSRMQEHESDKFAL